MKRLDSGKNYARFEMGDLTIVALRDGYVDMPPSRLRQSGDRPFGPELPAQVEFVNGKLRLSVNAYLVIGHGQHILIDTGSADAWDPTMGLLPEALREAGIARGSIGTVAFTHTHIDHVHGLVAADGSDTFPKLERLLVPQEEIAMFDEIDRLARFRHRRQPFADGFELNASIKVVAAHGHEVGHSVFEVTSAPETLLIWGDIIHVPSIQFARPEVTWEFDDDQDRARSTRQLILHRAAQPNCFVAGAHLDFPGVGKVAERDGAYGFASL